MVSIHAPVWERSQKLYQLWFNWDVSIHAPVWERRLLQLTNLILLDGFNPRSRVGAEFNYYHNKIKKLVSIHAPVWERSRQAIISCSTASVSIHAPVWERSAILMMARYIWFEKRGFANQVRYNRVQYINKS